MRFPHRILASACLALLTSACATFGTNIEGDFTCRAPKGDCAPSHVIDARADVGHRLALFGKFDVSHARAFSEIFLTVEVPVQRGLLTLDFTLSPV